jgi:hypothetical protein
MWEYDSYTSIKSKTALETTYDGSEAGDFSAPKNCPCVTKNLRETSSMVEAKASFNSDSNRLFRFQ